MRLKMLERPISLGNMHHNPMSFHYVTLRPEHLGRTGYIQEVSQDRCGHHVAVEFARYGRSVCVTARKTRIAPPSKTPAAVDAWSGDDRSRPQEFGKRSPGNSRHCRAPHYGAKNGGDPMSGTHNIRNKNSRGRPGSGRLPKYEHRRFDDAPFAPGFSRR